MKLCLDVGNSHIYGGVYEVLLHMCPPPPLWANLIGYSKYLDTFL